MKNKTCGKNQGVAVSVTLLAFGFSGVTAFAAANASDTAANYVGSWSATPANLGTGFGAWANQAINNNNPPYSGTYLDQTSYGNSDGVLSAGYAWGTYANSGPPSPDFILSRPFTTGGGTASLLNQTFSIGIGSSGIGGAGSSLTLGVGSAFSLSYAGGGTDNMLLSIDGGTASAIPVAYANLNAGLLVAFTVTGAMNSTSESYGLTISPFAGGAPIYSTSGTFDALDYNTSSFSVSDLNTSNDGFVNNPTIIAVPEPSSLAVFAASGLGMLLALRRRK